MSKRILTVHCLLAVWLSQVLILHPFGLAQELPSSNAIEETPEHANILETVRTYVDAYNRKDAAAVASHWAEDAVMFALDTGERIKGRDAIRDDFTRQFEAQPNAKLAVEVTSIRLVTEAVAVEDGLATIRGDGPAISTSYTVVHVKQSEGWKIDSVRETVLPGQSGTQLTELDWLVGRWIDRGENSVVDFDVNWARNDRFLAMNFRVTAEGAPSLEGTQIIGTDPATGKIRSWLFDSDGGIGQGSWTKRDGKWIAEMSMTLPDGQAASATNIYTPIDSDSYKWESVARKVAGEFLPDIPAVLVNRAAE